MGVPITELLVSHETSLAELKGKSFAVDAFNTLYQFVTTIRMQDGTPLTDSKGRVTSHLAGLLSRTTALMAAGLKLVFVFDGEAPELKRAERERRKAVKRDAAIKYEAAEKAEDVEEMKKYAGRTATLTPEMVDEAKALLGALGVPCVQAPSEGEAQAAAMCKDGEVYAVISQDADSFLFGAPRAVKNLNLTGRRKKASTLAYEQTRPQLIELQENLAALGLSHEQLILLALLVGTDYNRAGIKGIGPKKALKLLREHGDDHDALFAAANWDEEYPDLAWRTLLAAFTDMPTTKEYELAWTRPDEAALKRLLIDHDFSEERVTSALAKLEESDAHSQKGLGEFF